MTAEPRLQPETVVAGRYRVDNLLGMGGFGEVYRATEDALDRPVALKVLHAGISSETQRLRFKREAKLIARLSSPNTVRLFDFGEWEEQLFMVLELVDGRDLVQVIEEDGPFDGPRVMSVLQQALRSLSEAHAIGVLHRDIKLQNLMLYESADQKDLVKVLDFGIARVLHDDTATESDDAATVGATLGRPLTSEGELIGTPRYMSPEQARGRPLTPTSDLYSLGILALELVTGRPWLEGTSPLEIAHHHIKPDPNRVPPGVDIDPDIAAIIERLAEKQPEARYASAADALADIDRWERREPLQVISTHDASSDFALKPTDITGNNTARGIPTWMTAVPTRTGKFRYEFEMRNAEEQRLDVELYDTEPMLLRVTTVPARRDLWLVVAPLLGLSLLSSGQVALGAVALSAIAFLYLSRNSTYRVIELSIEGETYSLEVRDEVPIARAGELTELRRIEVRDDGLWLAASNPENDALLATISETAKNRARWVEGKLNQKLARAARVEAPTVLTPVTVEGATSVGRA